MSIESEIKKLTEAVTEAIALFKASAVVEPKATESATVDETKTDVNPEAAAASVADIFGTDEPAATTPSATMDDVKTALKAFMTAKGDKATIDLLGKFSANKISELKEEDYAKIIAAATV